MNNLMKEFLKWKKNNPKVYKINKKNNKKLEKLFIEQGKIK